MAKVLVVDDAAFMRLMVRNILEDAGHEVVSEAVDGSDAIEKYRRFRPELVIMDITMPVMEGVEAVGKICNAYHNAKIIMCSAMGQRDMVVDSLKAGAIDFVVKPIQNNRLLEAVDRAMFR
ncbi:response regulator [Paenibacillus agricola]|uniref:Response regulator n=1 Tax=Paenibacillus agricola TaxID=2716264 RepID=A0ABX0J566_9BACL|nr:response regulator [Paenibacillus agricola]NHN29184.1 response regulator [Paenibacillus agricola]